MLKASLVLLTAGACLGFSPSPLPALRGPRSACPAISMQATGSTTGRREALAFLAGGAAWLANVKLASAVDGPEGLKYEIVKSGKGPQPKIGDLVAIRFKVRWTKMSQSPDRMLSDWGGVARLTRRCQVHALLPITTWGYCCRHLLMARSLTTALPRPTPTTTVLGRRPS